MREIKFRGRRKDNGEWLYGEGISTRIFTVKGETSGPWLWVAPKVNEAQSQRDTGNGGWNPVHGKTVGQYTGLKDTNGKKIWEGDILRWAISKTKRFIVIWDNVKAAFALTWMNNQPLSDCGASIGKNNIVIGNIHENPELLEKTT